MFTVPDRLNEGLAGRYLVERVVGEGGMATVYLARDLRHGRSVAMKVLRPELAAAVGAERFLSEIRTTANLQHPNILPLHDSGEVDGLVYYTMPFVDGQTLRDRLDNEGRLPIAEAISVVRDVAEALQAAHDAGVVHRDVKPSNVLLSRGRALVADFGIAHARWGAEGTRLTQAGSSLGTVGYMSPEQADADGEVDHRADIYSLGAVLFEALSGELPYPGRTPIQILARQATEPLRRIRTLRPEVGAGVEDALTRALARTPADRFDSATAFADALKTEAPRGLGAGDAPTTVVVLPFVNRSADPEDEFFSDGLTDEVISDLASISSIRVISRNSSMTLKGTSKDTPTLARELGVSHVVSGTVRRAGSALRVTSELVDARTDAADWTGKFSGTMDDVFGIQEKISREIAAALKVTLTDAERSEPSRARLDDPAAYECYLRATQLMYTWSDEAQRRAMSYVDDAIALAGDSALLMATKANVYWSHVNISVMPPAEGLSRAEELVEQALALEPQFPLAIYVRGLIAGARGQVEAALADIYRAHLLRPSDGNILTELSRYCSTSGLEMGQAHHDRLERIDPLNPLMHVHRTVRRQIFGPREDAAEHARRAIALFPPDSVVAVYAGWPLAEAGFEEEAAEVMTRMGSLASTPNGRFALFLSCALRGDEEGALRIGTPELEQAIHNDFACRFRADAYALLGRKADAIRCVRQAVENGFINYPNLSEGDRFLEPIRREPEFLALMDELRPRWEAVVEWERGLTS